jgi:hypothetical protein
MFGVIEKGINFGINNVVAAAGQQCWLDVTVDSI